MKSNPITGKIGLIQGIDAPAPPQVTWTPCFRTNLGGVRGAVKSDMDFLFSFSAKANKAGKVKKAIFLRLAHGLLKKIGWEDGDNILLCYDKDDQKNMMIFKHPKGYKLNPESGFEKAVIKVSRIGMTADWCVLPECLSKNLKYTIDATDKESIRLIFRVE